jgi:hypothetical protein
LPDLDLPLTTPTRLNGVSFRSLFARLASRVYVPAAVALKLPSTCLSAGHTKMPALCHGVASRDRQAEVVSGQAAVPRFFL